MRLPPTLSRARRTDTGRGPIAALIVPAGLLGAVMLLLARMRRIEVRGPSMEPTLLAGDRLLVIRTPSWWPFRVGQLVAVPDPRQGQNRMLVKRIDAVNKRSVDVRGDNPLASTDSRHLGPLNRQQVIGRVFYRYAPTSRSGWLT